MEKRAAKGRPTPALDSREEPYDDLFTVWQAFLELSMSRGSSGFGPLPIRAEDVKAWLDIHGVDDTDTRVEYYELISALDRQWLEHMASESELKSKETGKNAHAAPGNQRGSGEGRTDAVQPGRPQSSH